MNKMLLSIHQNWHVGIAEYTPSQNNGLESHNLVIRKEETFRERMPLSRFLHQSLQAVEKWSKQYETKDKIFIDVPTIALSQWTEAYQWAKSNKIVTSKTLDNSIEYYCPVKDEIKVTEEQIQTVKEMRWNTFDQFKRILLNASFFSFNSIKI